MKSCLVKCLWIPLVLLVLFQFQWCCSGCLEEERIALLEFKASFDWISDQLPSWVDNDERGSSTSTSTDCCSWEQVKCNATTGRVIQLSLGGFGENFENLFFRSATSSCSLNVTIFSSFKELQHLNLSYNFFHDWIQNEGFERLGELRKLEVLDLSGNYFNNTSIFSSLGELKSLRNLSVQGNSLVGSIDLEAFVSALPNMKSLDLSYNGLEGMAYSSQTKQGSTVSFVGLGKLEALHLEWNNFNNSVLPFLGELTSLKTLSLGSNNFEGLLHMEALSNLHNLESLDLSEMGFSCTFQPILQELTNNLRNLQLLDLSSNHFRGCSQAIFQAFISTLHNLKSLDLSSNYLEASMQTKQGSTSFVGLGKLEALHLGGNYLNNSILPFLGALASLRTLSLFFNNLEGSLNMEEFGNLHNLESLDLSGNGFNCSLQPIQESANNLPNLQSLDLSDNNFNCSSEEIFQALCGMKRLQELYLSWNNFEGILPLCLQNLTSLRILDLSDNQLNGNIPSSIIASLSSLSQIFLGYNDFEGTFTFKSFANSSKLEVIDLTSAGRKLEIETELPPWVPLFQLKELWLSNCNLNKQSNNAFPSFLSTQHNLSEVDLSNCNLNGLLPPWLLENNKMLGTLILRNNSLRGHFLLPSYVHYAAVHIDISNNCIDGLLRENIGNIFPNTKYLNLSMNTFEGGIPSSIGNMSYLTTLNLSNNNFIGKIPKHMGIGCSNLCALGLSNNKLQGQVFPLDFNFIRLQSLHLDNNLFSGSVLRGLSKCNNLLILDISNNQITGKIPSWIGNLTSLMVLKMRGNLLEGNIPIEFQVSMVLEFLDLSENHLSGSIVSLLNSTSLQHLHLEGNGFIGSPSIALINNSNLLTLDIRSNNLCGGIPDWMGALSGLRVLLLQRNHLSGPIPNNLCQLKWIRIMDLSHNSLFGPIPRCFNNISFGKMKEKESISNIKSKRYLEIGFEGSYSELVWVGAIEEIEFMTKSVYFSYKGGILNFMSGMDLSFNNLTGDIPHEIGTLKRIHALNLSHNQLIGSIPKTFSNLKQIESLDLSYNKLNGEIPSKLTTLYSLEVFTVAQNNLSGKTPEMKGQFSTFDSSSYEGNPFLCGLPLPNTPFCSSSEESTNTSTTASNDVGNEYDIDMTAFASSFASSYAVCILGLATILYINPYWRRMWFHFIGACIYSCHDFLSDTYYKLSIHVHRFRLLTWKTLIE